jgi:hypothetical protein
MFSLGSRVNDFKRWLLVPITYTKNSCPETISALLCTWTFVWLSRFHTKPLCQPDGTQCWNALHLEMSVQSERRFSHLQHYYHICITAWSITLLPSKKEKIYANFLCTIMYHFTAVRAIHSFQLLTRVGYLWRHGHWGLLDCSASKV